MKGTSIVVVVALLLLLAACGAGSGDVAGAGSLTSAPTASSTSPGETTTTTTATTTTTPPSTTPPPTTPTVTTAPATTSPPVTTAPTTTPPTTTTTTPPQPATLELAAYLLIDEPGHDGRTGPFLVPVARTVTYTTATATAAVEALLDGPTGDESAGRPGISSQIPSGARLNGVAVADGTATVDVRAAFGVDEASPVAAVRVAQVVFTLTRFASIERVAFQVDGEAVAVQTSDGQLVDRPVTRSDFRDFEAIIAVESPMYSGRAGNPLRVTGEAAVFEAQFHYLLADDDGLIIAEGDAMAAEGNTWSTFDFTIPYTVDAPQRGALIVWVYSAKDGSQVDVREYPVTLQP